MTVGYPVPSPGLDSSYGEGGPHETDFANPHSVSKTQIGLDNVDNTSDVDKPVSTAAQAALDAKADATNNVSGDGTILRVVKLTQAAYNALTPVATTLYIIEG